MATMTNVASASATTQGEDLITEAETESSRETPQSFIGIGRRVGDGIVPNDSVSESVVALRSERLNLRGRQQHDSLGTLWARLQDPSFFPPVLLALDRVQEFGSDWTWFGEIDRFELVKSCKRSRVMVEKFGPDSKDWVELSDGILDWVVRSHEVAEKLLIAARPSEGALVYEAILDVSNSDVLSHVKLALSLMAAGVLGVSAASTERSTSADVPMTLKTKNSAIRLLAHAVYLEPSNQHLAHVVDIALRAISGEQIPDWLLSAEVPRSPGIDHCLLILLRSSSACR